MLPGHHRTAALHKGGAGEREEVRRWCTGELGEDESGGEQQPYFLGRTARASQERGGCRRWEQLNPGKLI